MIITQDDQSNAMSRMPRKSIQIKKKVDDKTVPHITNLHEDPMLSGIVYTSLVKGEIHIGRRTGDPVPDVILGAIGI